MICNTNIVKSKSKLSEAHVRIGHSILDTRRRNYNKCLQTFTVVYTYVPTMICANVTHNSRITQEQQSFVCTALFLKYAQSCLALRKSRSFMCSLIFAGSRNLDFLYFYVQKRMCSA